MKIILVNPKYTHTSGATLAPFTIPPLSLMKCAWLLQEQGHTVELKDFQVSREPMFFWAESAEADIIIVSTAPILNWQCPQSEIDDLVRLLSILKKRGQNLKIIGPHSLLTDYLNSYGDVLIGEPEGYMFDLTNQKEWDFSGTGKLLVNHPTDYFFPVLGSRVMSFEAIRGCSVGCDFCFQGMYKSKKKDLDALVDEIRNDIAAGYNKFFNVDLNFSLDPNYMERFADRIKEFGIKWGAHATLVGLKNIDLDKLARSGCKVLMVGIENRHQKGLPNKNLNENFVHLMIGKIQHSGIKVGGYFILGEVNDSKDDVIDTIRYSKELNLNYASFQIFHPLPQTDAYAKTKVAKNRFGLTDHYTGDLEIQWLKKMQKRAFRSFYFRPSYILKNLDLLLEPQMVVNGIASILGSNFRI